MNDRSLTDNLGELNEVIKRYINARINLVKIIVLDKLTKALTLIITAVLLFITISFVIILLTLAFCYWYSNKYGSMVDGLLISAGFYIFIILIIYWLRKPLISNTIIKVCAPLFFNDQEKEQE